ncbi:hypothetical protein GC176_16650 [bacterium]|nr:hypothetical protein [bacterium]
MKPYTSSLAAVVLSFAVAFVPAGSRLYAQTAEENDDISSLLPGEPSGNSNPGPAGGNRNLQILQSKIAELEQRIRVLEQRQSVKPANAQGDCPQAVVATSNCAEVAALTTGNVATSQVVVRRYLVPLSTTTQLLPAVNSTVGAGVSLQGLGATTLAPNVSVLAAPAAPVTMLAPSAGCLTVSPNLVSPNMTTLGTSYSTFGAYPTTVYRGAGAVYSNSFNSAALNTGSGVTFLRIQ